MYCTVDMIKNLECKFNKITLPCHVLYSSKNIIINSSKFTNSNFSCFVSYEDLEIDFNKRDWIIKSILKNLLGKVFNIVFEEDTNFNFKPLDLYFDGDEHTFNSIKKNYMKWKLKN